jgi:photosystem II stability/assembly factor-like uncharacterized protein
MCTQNRLDRARYLLLACTLLMLAACGGSGAESTPLTPPPDPEPPDLPAALADIRVVASDGDSGDVQNTISWTGDPDATAYTVYWDNVAGVTASSSVVVPTAEGIDYVVHSGVDVVAGNTYFYRVKATSDSGDSALSSEVTGTPQQSITGNQLNGVAWNGTDTIVAVGDSGVIVASPNGTTDGWVDVSAANVPQALAAVTWEDVNAQFMIVGAGNTVLTGDGASWVSQDLSYLPGAVNLQDVAWLGDRYIVVGNNGAILTSNADGSLWSAQNPGAGLATGSFNAVATNGTRIVVVGNNGTIGSSVDAVTWNEQPRPGNNDLNDISWDGTQFTIVGSNDTVLTSPDGLDWKAHVPGTSDINFVAVPHWDAGLPADPLTVTVGSSGTIVVEPDADPGLIVRSGTTEQLGGIAWVGEDDSPAYFVIVGNDGTVATVR